MKRIIVVLLCFVVFFGLMSGCENAGDPYEIFAEAIKSAADIKSMDFSYTANVKVSAGGSTLVYPISGNRKKVIKTPENIEMETSYTSEFLGEKIQSKTYYTGGIYYIESDGEKYKTVYGGMEPMLFDLNIPEILEFVKPALKGGKASNASGGKKLSFDIDAEFFVEILEEKYRQMDEEFYNDLVEDLDDGEGWEGEEWDEYDEDYFSFIDAKESLIRLEIVLDANYIVKEAVLTAQIKISDEDYKADVEIDFSVIINSVNDVVIAFPSDLDTYIDYDELYLFDGEYEYEFE